VRPRIQAISGKNCELDPVLRPRKSPEERHLSPKFTPQARPTSISLYGAGTIGLAKRMLPGHVLFRVLYMHYLPVVCCTFPILKVCSRMIRIPLYSRKIKKKDTHRGGVRILIQCRFRTFRRVRLFRMLTSTPDLVTPNRRGLKSNLEPTNPALFK
jgi:hypothetical protein